MWPFEKKAGSAYRSPIRNVGGYGPYYPEPLGPVAASPSHNPKSKSKTNYYIARDPMRYANYPWNLVNRGRDEVVACFLTRDLARQAASLLNGAT